MGRDMQKMAAFRSGEGENRMKALDQEGLIDGDLELRVVDRGGMEATLNRLSLRLVSFAFCVIVILRHDAEAMWLLSGSLLDKVLSTVLKRVLNQARPVTTRKSDPGMPSSHAQSIFFLAAYVVVSIVESLEVNMLTLFLGSLVFALASYFSWLRVSLQYHTVSQVLVGAIVGSAFSVSWIWLWNAVIHEAYISHLLVRVCVVLGAVGFSCAVALHVIRHRLKDDK